MTGNTINIVVNNPDQIESYQIMNVRGQVMITDQLFYRNNKIDISNFINGVYIIKIAYTNNTHQIEKLIVK